jgi:integrase
LAGGWLNVGRSKTDAGVRRVRIRPALRDELLALKANTPGARLDALVFGTVTGKSQSQSNVRRMLTKAATRANRELAETGELPLPAITPHSCRRTFASVLLACGESLPVVMSDGGWEKPDVPLRIYGQVMNRDPGENDRLRALVGERESAPEGASAIVDLAA